MVYVTTSKIQKQTRKKLEKVLRKVSKLKKSWIFENRGSKSINEVAKRAVELGETEILIFSLNGGVLVYKEIKANPYSWKWKSRNDKVFKLKDKDLKFLEGFGGF